MNNKQKLRQVESKICRFSNKHKNYSKFIHNTSNETMFLKQFLITKKITLHQPHIKLQKNTGESVFGSSHATSGS